MDGAEPGNGGASRVTGYELLRTINELDRKFTTQLNELDRENERRQNALRGDVRAVDQSINGKGGLIERLEHVEAETESLRSRFSYALYIIGGAIAAAAFFFTRINS